jgi:hypothetical protein
LSREHWSHWQDASEYYFVGWFGNEQLPQALSTGVMNTLGGGFSPKCIYPVGEYTEGRVSLLAVTDRNEATLIEFEPPSTTRISFLGSLAGGTYVETIDSAKDRCDQRRGTFSHSRLSGYSFEVWFRGPPDDQDPDYIDSGQKQAWQMFERVRETFRYWATEPERRPPDRS